MTEPIRRAAILGVVVAAIASGGCKTFSSYTPTPLAEVGFQDRIQTATKGDLTVSVAVLSAEEAQLAYDLKLYKKKMQPIWIEVENRGDRPVLFLPRSVDEAYISSLEGAYRSRWTWNKKANKAMQLHFYDLQIPFEIPSGSSISGIVLGTRHKGVRLVAVDLVGIDLVERFEFVVEVPGFKADYKVAQEKYGHLAEEWETRDLGEDELRAWLEELPCCTKNAKGTKTGDPLNLVVIGDSKAVWPAFLRAGWDPTASLTAGSAAKTGLFGLFGGSYRYAPISSLYAFDRPQDVALQKVRHNIHLRNHLRLWATPITFRGQPVWVGQISRDIGTRMTTKSPTLTTHKIDPDVDETRSALIQDFMYSGSLAAFAYAKGVGAVTPVEPRGNLTGDPWFTDGLRAVILLTDEHTPLSEIEYLRWEDPPTRWTADEVIEAVEASEPD